MIDFNVQTNADLNLPLANVNVAIVTKNGDGSQVATFTITKGKASTTHQITISKFIKYKHKLILMQQKRLLDLLDKHKTTIEVTSFKSRS